MAKGQQEPLRIWVLPVGDGDSIVFRLPNGTWAIVDSHFVPGQRVAAARAILRDVMPAGENVEFICLTHYHKDHYLGLFELFNETASRNLGDKGHFFHNGFDFAEAYPDVGWSEIDSVLKIRDKYYPPSGAVSHLPERYGINDSYQPVNLSSGVTLQFLAPGTGRSRSIRKTLIRSAQRGKFAARPFNRLGIAFTLTYGKATILITDDIERPTWKTIRSKHNDLRPCWMMVSHHGARSNNPDWLWPWLAGGRQRERIHAVISADGIEHPNPKVVAEAEKHFTLHATYTDDHSPVRTSTPADTFTRRGKPRPRTSHPSQTWLHSAYPEGRVCAFEVYPNARVVVVDL